MEQPPRRSSPGLRQGVESAQLSHEAAKHRSMVADGGAAQAIGRGLQVRNGHEKQQRAALWWPTVEQPRPPARS